MATFRRRGDRWQARVQRRGMAAMAKTFTSKADAQRWARDVEVAHERGELRPAPAQGTLADALARYELEFTPNKRGAAQERYRLAVLGRAPLASLPITRVRSTDIAAYRDRRLAEVSGTTVKVELNTLSAIFEACRLEWGYEVSNPVRGVKRPTANPGRDRRLEPGEQEALLAACEASRVDYLRPLVVLAMETAMRLGELMTLRWERIDLKASVASLPLTKNGSTRRVPLSTRAVAALEAYGPKYIGAVFPVKTNSIKPAFRRACVRAGLDDLHFHDLRHEAVSRLFEKGLHPFEVASISGHKTMSMLKRYTHLRPENLVAKLG